MTECLEDMCRVKMAPICIFDDGAKELVIICDHVHFYHKSEWTQDSFKSPKGAGPWRNPCDTDTAYERSVGGLTSNKPSLVAKSNFHQPQKHLKARFDSFLQ